MRGAMGLPVERDLYFKARGPMSKYADAARNAGGITQLEAGGPA